ncbi:MAG: PSD1 domain-containing protein [Verrucomicrobiales bacterium]|nr:PSD1 domain-containing protein [Verrucomicrobiales bacterium]
MSAAEPSASELAFFENKVRPLLVEHCYKCHSAEAEKVKGGLLLDSKDGWQAGGDSGEVIEPGKPNASLLIETVRYADPDLQMPPKYQLAEAEIAVLEDWVEMGAPDPRSGTVVAQAKGIDWDKGREHWAFQPVAQPVTPQVADPSWGRDDLDAFILSKMETAGLKPAPDADRFALIRRISLDLTGLPPTVEEVSAFVQDPAADDEALAAVVDRLLKSPAFGERWGRHWLDVTRYADSVGRTRNAPFPFAWRYRNYVMDAFNADKPYDQFLMEQVAGDLLETNDATEHAQQVVATGLLALGSMDLNERDEEQFQLDRIDDQMDTLGRATMGLTLGCARCHDHKFDPISQTDYYAMAGIFASTETLSGQRNRQGGNKNYNNASLLAKLDAVPAAAAASSASSFRSEEKARLEAQLKALQVENRRKSLSKKERSEIQKNLSRLRRRIAELERAAGGGGKKRKAQEQIDPNANLAMAATEGRVEDLALRVRGEPDIKGDIIPRDFPAILKQAGMADLPEEGSGRLELARWLTSPEHPLTARVMVNRIWAHLLGRGLVETVDNFGASGSEPTHPELLDHLASRFMKNGWSMKAMIRAIVLSRTYRLSTTHLAANAAADEGNHLYWRANLRRLEAEAIRDSLLAAGGMLQKERPEGAPFDGPVNGDLSRTKGNGSDAITRPVRSVYLPVIRSRLPGMFTVFDFAEPDQVNGQRYVTTVAPQALFLLNNDFVIETSRRAAQRILEQKLPDEKARVAYAYAYALCRRPTEAETQRALDYLGTGEGRERHWAEFTQALYSAAEFRYIP